MDKKLKDHQKYIEKELKAGVSGEKAAKLLAYHQNMTRNFQHERLIHLLVTFFFIAATLLIIGLYVAMMLSFYDPTLYICLGLLVLILSITDIFYVHHYYQLENGVQRLYELEKELLELN
ncbi:hypothetical protein FWF48_02050 [Candidatus Saccharibacteria bacterium]|nr:hypothetical protein [Candidatus Saccharibacteria bacterium]